MASSSARVLNCILNPSTVASWNSNIIAAANKGLNQDALLLYRRMKQAGVQPNHLTFPFVVKSCGKIPTPEIIHTHVLKSPFSADKFVGTAMVDVYVKCRQIDAALKLFERMPERDVATYNAMINGLFELGSLSRVLVLFRRMRLAEIYPDSVTVISLARSCACEKNLGVAKAVHCLGINMGVGADVSVANTWISVYAKCEDLVLAELVFSEISGDLRSVVSWNSMIAGYAFHGRSAKVADLFTRMIRDGLRPDLSTIVSLLSAFSHSKALLGGKLVHSLAFKVGFDSDVSVMNTLISLYSKCGDVDAARYCFDNMLARTCVSWSAMIDGYAKVGDIDGAFDLFYAMEATGERPDAVTVVALLSACSQTGALELGISMNQYAVINGFQENTVVRNALIDMYSKCGSVADARRHFDSMDGRTVVSWTAMIAGYAMNGRSDDALDIFSQMLGLGLRPNHVTFLAVLQACTHGGFLEKGWDYFVMMRNVYQINPRLEHYACMVHLLGHRGRLKEALEFIQSMQIDPDAGIWGALLGACFMHHEIEISEYVATRLFELEPQAAVSYVAMANIYASVERWDGVAKIRAMMKQKGVRKTPGQSALQVDGNFHTFTVEDKIHPESLEIYKVLDSLALHLKDLRHQKDLCILDYQFKQKCELHQFFC